MIRHVRILCFSYHHWTGRDLLDSVVDNVDIVQQLDEAPFALVSHGTEPDPIFNYANRIALRLFEMNWDDFTSMPSRLSAEPLAQQERDRLLARVGSHGYIDDYSGIRISSTGKRFMIRDATVWNLLDESGQAYGQAALLRDWQEV
ncbi:MAG: MEKHLA domain-containing protein [Methylophilaceae bacterium]|nr:MEKHLA domain-containing protein [Methylophilaceae bacterium]